MSGGQAVLLADAILVIHFLIAAFLVFGLPVIWVGAFLKWRFVRNPWFRFSHAGLMGFVLAETLLGHLCPLTVWEAALRGNTTGQGFIVYWVDRLLFHDLDPTVFVVAYALFFAAVLATFLIVPVRRGR